MSSHNQIYQLFFGQSLFLSRSLRLLFLFLGLHLEFALCAFFFDLKEEEGASEEQSLFSYSSLVSNFWVGLYSILLTTPLMLLVSVCFRMNSKHTQTLASINSVA